MIDTVKAGDSLLSPAFCAVSIKNPQILIII